MPSASREGLTWDDSGLSLVPKWQREPNIEAIQAVCRQELSTRFQDECKVSFLASGAFNKLYLVETDQKKFVMRVSLPVHPHHKTSSEVATLSWISDVTGLPVPEVIASDGSRDNGIGFEWILMTFAPGRPVYYQWRTISMAAKETLVEHVANAQSEFFRNTLRGIGSLVNHPDESPEKRHLSPLPGRLVSRELFAGDRYDYDISRGPFASSHDWLNSHLQIIHMDQMKAIENAEDEDDREDAEVTVRVTRRLEGLLPKIFPSIQQPSERTALWHGDLSLQNIMVDDAGMMSAVIDWECVSAIPMWAATQMPKFLSGRTREEKPIREDYGDETPEEADALKQELGDDALDNEGKNELYWIHLMEYDQTQLRKVYGNRMRQLWPSWDDDVADAALKVDFLKAVAYCAEGFKLKAMERWMGAIERGESLRLDKALEPTPVRLGS